MQSPFDYFRRKHLGNILVLTWVAIIVVGLVDLLVFASCLLFEVESWWKPALLWFGILFAAFILITGLLIYLITTNQIE